MRVLAIRGENINSLAERFEVRLDSGPLAGAGIFAITGPTGSGKTTLLDAMCLALFAKVPRQVGAGREAPGGTADESDDARVAANDCRAALRRGTASAFAEVEFVGVDGEVYCAKWSVRRARNRVEGRIQDYQHELRRVGTGEVVEGGGKTAVAKAIEKRLRLNFEQFCRSVLLAQGDFAAFLKASTEDRAGLLERVTGTSIYSELSVAAHRRGKEETEKLEGMLRESNVVVRMAPEERVAHQGELELLQAKLRDLEPLEKEARAAITWHERRAELEAQQRSATQRRAEARHDAEAVQGLRAEVEEAKSAEMLRSDVAAIQRAQEDLKRRQEDAAATRGALQQKDVELVHVTAEVDARAALVMAAEARETGAEEGLAAAQQLDSELSERGAQVGAARAEFEAAEMASALAAKEYLEWEDRAARAKSENDAVVLWLAQNQKFQKLAVGWAGFEGEFNRAKRLLGQKAGFGPTLQRLVQEASRADDAVREAAAEADGVASQVSAAKERALSDLQAANAVPLDATTQARARADGHLHSLQKALSRATEISRLDAEVSGLTAEAGQADRATVEDSVLIASTGESLVTVEARLSEAEGSAARLKDALGAEGMRQSLRAGDECPVCGAVEHPYASSLPAFNALLREAEARARVLLAEQTTLRATVHASNARIGLAKPLAQRARAWAARATTKAASLKTSWLSVPEVPIWDAQAMDVLTGALAAGEHLSRALAEAELQSRHLREVAQASGARSAALAGMLEKVSAVRVVSVQSAFDANHHRVKAEEDLKSVLEQLAETLEHLRPAMSGEWVSRFEADPEAFVQRCEKLVREWNAKQDLLRGVDESGIALQSSLAAKASRRTETAGVAEKRREGFQVMSRAFELAQKRRAGLLEGKSVDEARRSLRVAVEGTRASAQTCQKQREALRLEQAVLAQQEVLQHAGLTSAAAQSVELGRALEVRLAAVGLTLARAQLLLAMASGWLAAKSSELTAKDEALAGTELAARLKTEELSAFLARSEAPLRVESELRSALDACLSLRGESQERTGALTVLLTKDDEAQRLAAENESAFSFQQEKARVWLQLAELIGSQDGRKFRRFAQSLTLDALLQPTNSRLSELAPRYRLTRVPGQDLDLQVVDRDMGDDIRGIPSLSGGETFLVSLALALGLSSLSASQTPVETLFIDEGFGTLDADTLEVVLSILDSLQATGKQVGVISHVPGLGERIGVQVRVERMGQGRSRIVL